MASRETSSLDITPEVLLKAYSCGIFPMAESADDPALYWIEPQARGILPLGQIHVPRRLARTIRQNVYDIRIDTDFDGVITGCGASRPGRGTTWINDKIRNLYRELFRLGHCHTVEAWSDGKLVGGLYGVELGGAFFGESMFSLARDASKVALVHLAARLIYGRYTLLDCQFVTDHLSQFGTIEIERSAFHHELGLAAAITADFKALPAETGGARILDIVEGRELPPTVPAG
jgi:leucyl/phenylalanyl-tRNA---protein transferase